MSPTGTGRIAKQLHLIIFMQFIYSFSLQLREMEKTEKGMCGKREIMSNGTYSIIGRR